MGESGGLLPVPWGADLAAAAAQFGDMQAVHDGTRGITLAALARRAAGLALRLRADMRRVIRDEVLRTYRLIDGPHPSLEPR